MTGSLIVTRQPAGDDYARAATRRALLEVRALALPWYGGLQWGSPAGLSIEAHSNVAAAVPYLPVAALRCPFPDVLLRMPKQDSPCQLAARHTQPDPALHCPFTQCPNAPTAAAASLLHLHRPRVRPALFHLEVKPKVRPAKACAGWHFPGGRSACCSGVIESLGGPACQWQRQQPAHGAGQAMFSFCLLMPLVACIPPSAHPLMHPAPPACQPAALEGRLQNHGGGAAGAQI